MTLSEPSRRTGPIFLRRRTPHVLFLSTDNAVRSQMAEALLRHFGRGRFVVYSAGLEPRDEIDPDTIRVMDEVGINVRDQRCTSVKEYMGRVQFQYAITVCSHADRHCPEALWSTGVKLHWSLEDPAKVDGPTDARLAKFREVRDQIRAQVMGLLAG
jgi:protein-tyrosine-phosphatase